MGFVVCASLHGRAFGGGRTHVIQAQCQQHLGLHVRVPRAQRAILTLRRKEQAFWGLRHGNAGDLALASLQRNRSPPMSTTASIDRAAPSSVPAPAPARWPAVVSLAMGVFGLVTAEFLPASLLTAMASDLSITEGVAGQ